MSRFKTVTKYVVIAATIAAGIFGTTTAYEQATADPTPTALWRQSVVTIDDKATVEAAQGWGAPFTLAYAATAADIRVTRTLPGGKVAGEATPEIAVDTIIGCDIEVQTETETRAVLAHEIGHCLGLHGHAMTPTSLMHFETGRPGVSALDVTDADREALRVLYSE